MRKQTTTTRTLIHATAALIAIAVASPLQAAGPLVVYGDFNNDGLVDMAAVTSATTITVSLANPLGIYTVSSILTVPKNQPISYIGLGDRDSDGDLDLYANSPGGGSWVYTHMWSGNGNGTFGSRTTDKWSWPPKGNIGFF